MKSLNRNGGRCNLPPVWDNVIKKRAKAERPRKGWGVHRYHPLWDNVIKKRAKAERPRKGWGVPRYHPHAQRPQQHRRDDELMRLTVASESFLYVMFLSCDN